MIGGAFWRRRPKVQRDRVESPRFGEAMAALGRATQSTEPTSDTAERVTVSAINRNFPGRSGPGEVYLASPLVVMASAIAGHIVRPEDVLQG